jgi:hypothetical protein
VREVYKSASMPLPGRVELNAVDQQYQATVGLRFPVQGETDSYSMKQIEKYYLEPFFFLSPWLH